MPFKFTDVVAAGDVLPNNRHTLYFPVLPNGINGKELTLRHGTVSLPPWEVGQIIVKMYGWSLAFAGRRNNTNTFTADFVETTDAPVVKALLGWQGMCAGFKQPIGSPKAKYAVNCKFTAADTTGKSAIIGTMYNVWPVTVQISDFEENTDALHINATFSVDCVDIEDVTSNETALSLGTLTSVSHYAASAASMSSVVNLGNTVSTAVTGVNIAQSVVSALNLTSSSVRSILDSYF